MLAIENNFNYAVDKLLEMGVDIFTIDSSGKNALHIAVSLDKYPLAEKLVNHNKEIIDSKCSDGRTPLYLALEKPDEKTIKLLSSQNSKGYTLVYSISKGNYEIAAKVLNMDKSLADFIDSKNRSVLSIALESQEPKISQLLISNGASIYEAFRTNKSIKHLVFKNTYFNKYQIETISNELKNNPSIKHLSMVSCIQNIESLTFIKNISSLVCLDISSNNLGYEGAKILTKAFEKNKVIKIINCSDNNISEAGAIFFSELIKNNNHILSINISKNKIGYVGTIFIAKSLSENIGLVSIDISSNQIGDRGFKVLSESLKINKSLSCIFALSNNVSTNSINIISEALISNKTIINIKLSDENRPKIKSDKIIDKVKQNVNELILMLREIKSIDLQKLSEESFYKEDLFKSLFITLKQLQYKDLQAQDFRVYDRTKNEYIDKILGIYDYFISSKIPKSEEDQVYLDLLGNSIEMMQEV